MAFGDAKGTLSGTGLSVTNPSDATGSVAVDIGDLIIAVMSQEAALTVTGVTDNLGNTYTAQNAGSLASGVSGRMFYSRVTVAGTLTVCHFAATASANNFSVGAVVYAGGFLALWTYNRGGVMPCDRNPANVTDDTVTPYSANAINTMRQSVELIIGWITRDNNTSSGATSPGVVNLSVNDAGGRASLDIQSWVVSSTASVTPSFTTSAPSTDVIGAASFLADLTVTGYNRVAFTATSTGTGTFTNSAVITGYRTMATASIPDGTMVGYIAINPFSANPSEWETGRGMVTASATKVTRAFVRESSNSNALVNFSVAPSVYVGDLQKQDLAPNPDPESGGDNPLLFSNRGKVDALVGSDVNVTATGANTLLVLNSGAQSDYGPTLQLKQEYIGSGQNYLFQGQITPTSTSSISKMYSWESSLDGEIHTVSYRGVHRLNGFDQGDANAVLIVDGSGSANTNNAYFQITTSNAFSTLKAFQITRSGDGSSFASFEWYGGFPGFGLGPGSAGRDIGISRGAAGILYINNGSGASGNSGGLLRASAIGINVDPVAGSHELDILGGTTTSAPIHVGAGTNMTTPAAGAFEYDGNELFFSPAASDRRYIQNVAYIRQHATFTLSNATSVQKLFNGSANGRVTLPTGTYRFKSQFLITAMSATSGNAAFSIANGTGTGANFLYNWLAIDGVSATIAAPSMGTAVTSATPAAMATAGTSTSLQAIVEGSFEVSGAGTFIPSIQLATGASAVVAIGSYFECWRVGAATDTILGNWS